MNTQATELQDAEDDLKQLMADVTRAIEKAQEAMEKITSNATAATIDTQPTPSSPAALEKQVAFVAPQDRNNLLSPIDGSKVSK
jgi:Tfp pilus assembly protein PilP